MLSNKTLFIIASIAVVTALAVFAFYFTKDAVAPTINTTFNSANANLTFETNTNSPTANVNTGVACTGVSDCIATCESTTCGPTTQRVAECQDGQCQCACIENGPEDTFDPMVQLYNGPVGAACIKDSDCTLVNDELDYSSCYPGYCDVVDYSLPKYVAVNADAFIDFRESIKDDGDCGVQPACPVNFIDSGFRAACVDSVCRKVSKVSD